MRGGLLWYEVIRTSPLLGLEARTILFVPEGSDTVELMRVTLRNLADTARKVTPTAAIPLYGRSADNIRDHRHVTSLLSRVTVMEDGIALHPTMTFDERGHQKGERTYTVTGRDEAGIAPLRFLVSVRDYVGEGSYDWPDALEHSSDGWLKCGDHVDGYEPAAVLQWEEMLLPGYEEKSWYLALGVDCAGRAYLTPKAFAEALDRTRKHWEHVGAAHFVTGNPLFDRTMDWVAVQPEMRRICGCSFRPHHDYGRGGRGWRDLWQDSLALILRDPKRVHHDLVQYFAGVRRDGTNATIIGTRPGEFIADRNRIVRVWMDHGFWPLVTVRQYLSSGGDPGILMEKVGWFTDDRKMRGEVLAHEAPASTALGGAEHPVKSTVLEHLLTENVTAFFDAGEHGMIRLRGADWNDALDMAGSRGESIAFTAAYAGNLKALSEICAQLPGDTITLGRPLAALLGTETLSSPEARNAARRAYEEKCETDLLEVEVAKGTVAAALSRMATCLRDLIRETAFVTDGRGHRWMNSYIDNDGAVVEGARHDRVRMMLTGQVFALMSGTASEEDTRDIMAAADTYLFDPKRGGYCLNTDFGEDIPPLGRQFGFAYGHKENGAVFSHMAVMYAYALFTRREKAAGWKVLRTLLSQAADTQRSRIYPGIPEYFDPRGIGMYPYLTGAASWLMLTYITQVFGLKGTSEGLLLDPQLDESAFDEQGKAEITAYFAGRRVHVTYLKGDGYDRVEEVRLAGRVCAHPLPAAEIAAAAADILEITARLGREKEGDAQ
ncbi:MAG: cellobiose phosphorylase [Clostridia bacterium]|nr:cellobiose phosphorylase [Clostridia bacterium]